MRSVKYRLMDNQLYDYPLIQQQLSEQAARGWHLEKVGGLLWKYRRGEPKQVRYEVTYSSAASAFNSRPTDAEEDLAELCAQAGWVRVASAAQLQVFRNEDPNATPLETDEEQRLENIRKTMKKHFFPQHTLMVVLFLLQFFMHASNLLRWPSRTLSDPVVVTTLLMLPLVSLTYLVLMLSGWRWLRRARKAVDAGQPIPVNRFYRRFRWVIWAGLLCYLGSLFAMADLFFAWSILAISAISIGCVFGCVSLCKYLQAPKWVNMVVPTVVTAIVIGFLLTLFAIQMDQIALNGETPHTDTLPLTLADLGESGHSERILLEESSSPLAAYQRFVDHAGEQPLHYVIVDIRCPIFYDMILNEQEQNFLQSASYQTGFESVQDLSALWDAEYVRRATDNRGDLWLLCWEDRIVSLRTPWSLTSEQIAIAAELLKP